MSSISKLILQGSALGAMVGQMTYGKRQWDEFDSQMRKLIPVVTSASTDMIKMIDADTNAFNDYMVRKKNLKS
jgi:glutamate formiminotransferase/formiminotetrahydrofolate cyclodeaminase